MITGYFAESMDQLTNSQRKRLRHLVRMIVDAVAESARSEWPGSDVKQIEQEKHLRSIARPHNAFLIDGARGSGKTYVLLTLEHILHLLAHPKGDPILRAKWASQDGKPDEKVVDLDQLDRARQALPDIPMVMPFRIIFPADLTDNEYVMEALFAALRNDIEERCKDKTLPEPVRERGRALLGDLTQKVAKGHYHALKLGTDSVVRDSLTYDSLVEKYDKLNALAATRGELWRTFIDDFIRWRGVQTLAILLDDSDLRPHVSYDLLQTIRNMLSHPRIITVVAGNMRSMRASLQQLSMEELAKIMPVLNRPDHPLGNEWRQQRRMQVEQALEKILPESRRFFILPPATADYDVLMRAVDFPAGKSGDAVQAISSNVLMALRNDFMRTKMRLGLRKEMGGTEIANQSELRALDDYVGWWLFQTKYLAQLRPASARQAMSFAEFYAKCADGKTRPDKRLAVSLFDRSSNYDLIHRIEDGDGHVANWLNRQTLEAQWGEHRAFEINGRRIPADTYTHDFLCYRLDQEMALPIRTNVDGAFPVGLLPIVRGRKHIRQFFRLDDLIPKLPRRLGVSRWLNHAAIPGNCLYLHHLNALPAMAFASDVKDEARTAEGQEGKGGEWEAMLYARWPDLIAEKQPGHLMDYLTALFGDLKGTGEARTADVRTKMGERGESTDYPKFAKADLERKVLQTRKKSPENDPYYWVGRQSALFTDLRSAWFASLIWERSHLANTTGTELAETALSFSDGTEVGQRMRLFSHNDLVELFSKDNWSSNMLQIFDQLVGAGASEQLQGKLRQLIGNGSIFEHLEQRSPVAKEYFEKWSKCWRQVGRHLCGHWVIGKNGERGENDLVDDLFIGADDDFRIRVFEDNTVDDTTACDKMSPAQIGARAREFAWLIYGLAPNLPAMIHVDVVGTYRTKGDAYSLLDQWEKLILKFTGIMRYIEYKCLTMYLVSTFYHLHHLYDDSKAVPAESVQGRADDSDRSRFKTFLDQIFLGEDCNPERYGKTTAADEWIEEFWQEIKPDGVNDDRDPLLTDLNIMTDTAPSTLFGEGWLEKVLLRYDPGTRQAGEDITERGGVFGETDIWLCSAYQMTDLLRKAIEKPVKKPSASKPEAAGR